MKKTRILANVLILTLPICMGSQACDATKENTISQQVLSKEMRKTAQLVDAKTPDLEFLRCYGLVQPTQQEIFFNQKKSRREAQATLHLQKTRVVPLTSLNVATVIYLEDNVGVQPTAVNIATTLNFLGLESVLFLAAADMN